MVLVETCTITATWVSNLCFCRVGLDETINWKKLLVYFTHSQRYNMWNIRRPEDITVNYKWGTNTQFFTIASQKSSFRQSTIILIRYKGGQLSVFVHKRVPIYAYLQRNALKFATMLNSAELCYRENLHDILICYTLLLMWSFHIVSAVRDRDKYMEVYMISARTYIQCTIS